MLKQHRIVHPVLLTALRSSFITLICIVVAGEAMPLDKVADNHY